MLIRGAWFAGLAALLMSSVSLTTNAKSTYRTGPVLPKLIDATLEELAVGLEQGTFSSVDLVNAYIARIKEVNPVLHAVIEINPDAVSVAKDLDDERANGTVRGPLHGIPILLKDNVATMDKMNNTAGSYSLLGAKVPQDSGVAAKLRKAGAIFLGKTNLSQWANYRSSNSSNGWSARGGQTYGAYYPGQDPCGSSSGSGVAPSVGLALAALGSETDGSIVCPSGYNNLVGIKPTVGLTSRAFVIPISEHQDTVGPMAKSVKDAAYVLQAMAGKDPNDNYTSAIPFETLPDYVGACDFWALKGKRIGVPQNALPNASLPQYVAVMAEFNKALKVLEEAGATVVKVNYTAWTAYRNSTNEDTVLKVDFIENLKSYISKLTSNPTGVKTLADVSNFTHNFPAEEYPSRDTKIWDSALSLNISYGSAAHWAAYQQNQYLAGAGGLLGALQNNSLDAIVLPTLVASGQSAIIGAPLVTVPLGAYPINTPVIPNNRGNLNSTAPNIPFGISFAGPRFSEESLIGFAYAFEQRTMVRTKVKPYVVPFTELEDFIAA